MPRESQTSIGGRVQQGGRGVGPVTPEMIEDRAREIAEIEGRSGNAVTEDDRRRAAEELRNETAPLSSEEARSDTLRTRNPADVVAHTGKRSPTAPAPDEQQATEKEVKEGVREAEHERMLRSRRSGPPSA